MLPLIAPIPAQLIQVATQSIWELRTPSQSAEGYELEVVADGIYQRFSGGLGITEELNFEYTSLPLRAAQPIHVKYKFIGRIPPMPHSSQE